ncbi:MAG: division/cell wall cluster transcriptional repressor MraZ [Vulcanimicrobiota bacterium]
MDESTTEYLFSGTYEHTLDDKGRLTIPSSFRQDFSDGAVLRKSNDGSVEVLPRAAWNLFLHELKKISKTDVRGQRWVTRQLAAATSVELDKQGRVLVSQDLRGHGELEFGKVVVTGALDRLKVWNARRWAELETEEMEELDDYVYEKYQI